MELEDKVAVVTGGAGGIGSALARRFVAEGARGVLVCDLDGRAAESVAADLGDAALGIACDVSDEGDLERAVATALQTYGPIDLFCANAGVADEADERSDDEVWERELAVNLRAHILAARRLIPAWLERGRGYFLSTASAAGLLTQVGSAPYAVTKHAAVAFAEWLSVTYGERGVRVSCLCPMGVNTGMLRPDDDALPSAVVKAAGRVLEPEDVAEVVVEGIREERFLILPHPEVLTFFQRKAGNYDRWLEGMRKLQATIGASRPPA